MELYMTGINFSTNKYTLISHIAAILHSPGYTDDPASPMNFEVRLFRDKKRVHNHSGSGSLTLPTLEAGRRFLNEHGIRGLFVDNRSIKFRLSTNQAQATIVETIRRLPYVDPRAAEEQDRQTSRVRSEFVKVTTLQFGWECRDQVFSVEWEKDCTDCKLTFEPDRREIRIKYFNPRNIKIIAIRFSQVSWSSAHSSSSQQPVIFFSLSTPPAFEYESVPDPQLAVLFETLGFLGDRAPPLRQRLNALSPKHESFAPYTSMAIRLVCGGQQDLEKFRRLCKMSHFPARPSDFGYRIEYRGLFSQRVQLDFRASLLQLPWLVAFQIQSLLQSLAVDFKEMLALLPLIKKLVKSKGERYVSGFLRHFSGLVKMLGFSDDMGGEMESVQQCFIRSVREYAKLSGDVSLTRSENVFDCLHAFVTPSTTYFEGPYPDRSNRVIRSYPGYEDRFLRVSFVDEGRLQYRFDREVDGRSFIKKRFGPFLSSQGGLEIAGRRYEFLAYSQSSLKDHTVWFVSPFHHETSGNVDAASIIKGIGSFANLEFDRRLMHCPARYGARISQAFTATDASLSVEVDEIFYDPDIERNRSCFTDGVGTMSYDIAKAISEARALARPRGGKKSFAHILQIRFMGSKGMLSINHKLTGRAVCLRRSMIKFEAPESRQLEIAKFFDKPTRYYLNRPLIMILEGLGIGYDVFKYFQDQAVSEAVDSAASLSRAGRFLEAHGLGTSFRLTSVMINLDKIGFDTLEDRFYQQMMEFAIHHVLRDLKQRARIPIPGGWTLVGVADVHGFLEEGEIFACVRHPSTHKTVYLEGPTLISRSPTIHPGDVQVAHAIGKPPVGSCFALEALPNALVFSIKGARSLPSCLGGGDLDGDEYNVIPLNDLPGFTPTKVEPAAVYGQALRKELLRHSTMEDVADFVLEYISSDVVGIVATTWLIIADQSDRGIFDPACMTLAKLHSDAVDYPKSGQPVPVHSIPKPLFPKKPDWNAPEIANANSDDYYESQRAIGRLFREIDLPALKTVKKMSRSLHHQLVEDDSDDHFPSLSLDDEPFFIAMEEVVRQFRIDTDTSISNEIHEIFIRYASELRSICSSHSLSHSKSSMLTEEEAIIGTIVDRASQPRYRTNIMASLRETTELLVHGVRQELEGGVDMSNEEQLSMAWVAWKLSVLHRERFGAKSFGWIALGQIFDMMSAMKEV